MDRNNIIADFVKEKNSILQIVITGIVLSIGVRYLGTGLSDLLCLSCWSNIIVGSFIILIAILFLFYKVSSLKSRKLKINGVVFYDCLKMEIIHIAEYEYVNKIQTDLESAFLEDKGIEAAWKKFPLNSSHDPRSFTAPGILIQESEYFFLRKLSTHLSDYFLENNKSRSKKIEIWKRNDIPQILLQNSLLELFSRPRDKREAFIHNLNQDLVKDSKVCVKITRDYWLGCLYEYFELHLPKGSSIYRTEDNKLVIENKRLSLSARFSIREHNILDSDDFIVYYLGIKSGNIDRIHIELELDVKFKFLSFLSNRGWIYYSWIDSFLKYIENDFSFDLFLKRIDWDSHKASIQIEKNKKNAC